MQITRHGHACLLIEAADTRILVDPGIFSPDDPFELEDLSAVIVTHQHADHIDRARIAGLLRRNEQAVLLADPQTCEELGDGWRPTSAGTTVEVGGLNLTGVGAEHAVITPQVPRVANVGLLVTAADEPTLFHPGDSYGSAPEHVDVLALPLSAPWTKVAETIEFAQLVAPGTVLPIHDMTISELAYDIYWGHVANFAGVADARRLGQRDVTRV